MADEHRPLFLERSRYRRRRFLDAVKLLVFFGIILWMIPTLWPSASEPNIDPIPMSHALFYIFGVWLFLIVLAAIFQTSQRGRKDRTEPVDTSL